MFKVSPFSRIQLVYSRCCHCQWYAGRSGAIPQSVISFRWLTSLQDLWLADPVESIWCSRWLIHTFQSMHEKRHNASTSANQVARLKRVKRRRVDEVDQVNHRWPESRWVNRMSQSRVGWSSQTEFPMDRSFRSTRSILGSNLHIILHHIIFLGTVCVYIICYTHYTIKYLCWPVSIWVNWDYQWFSQHNTFVYVCVYVTVWCRLELLLQSTCWHSQEAIHQPACVLWQVTQRLREQL